MIYSYYVGIPIGSDILVIARERPASRPDGRRGDHLRFVISI